MNRYRHLDAAFAILAMAQASAPLGLPSPAAEPAKPLPTDRKLTGKSLRRIEKRQRRATIPKDRHDQ